MISNNYKYHKVIDEYIYLIESGQAESSEDIKLMINLVKDKLNQTDIIIAGDKINKAIEKIEEYFPFKLLEWEKFIIATSHCYYSDGSLVWDKFLIMCGRGSGKNGLISSLAFYFTTSFHGIKEYNVDIVANSEQQAKTSFEDVYNAIEENKKLQKAFHRTKKEIIFKKTKSYIKYNTSNARTKDGLRSAMIVYDEIHEYEDYKTIKVFTSGLGKKKNPRTYFITTNGNVRGGVLDDYLELAKAILTGENKTSRMLPLLYRLDNKEEARNPIKWEKANPSINTFTDLKITMLQEWEEALAQPSLMIEFLTKRMNIPAQDAFGLIASWDKIRATEQEIPDLTGWSCIGAIDYASVRDFISVGLLFKNGDKRIFIHHTFIVKKALEIDSRPINIDVEMLKEKGLITVVNKDSMDTDLIAEWFMEKTKKYNILDIVADHFRVSLLRNSFSKYGLPLSVVRSGTITHTLIHPLIEKLFADENIIFGDDPLMRWYTNNIYVETDAKDNKCFKKQEPIRRKTDGFFAFIHAMTKEDTIPINQLPMFYDCYTY